MKYFPLLALYSISLVSLHAAEQDPAIVQDLRSCWQISSRPLVNLGQDMAPEALLSFRKPLTRLKLEI